MFGRPESELLVCCARTSVNSEQTTRLQALVREKIEWDSLFRSALRHGVMPLVCRHLLSICPDAISADVLARMEDLFRANVRRNLSLTAHLVALLKLLESNGIRAVPFKGPVLGACVYGDLALRQFSDLDVFIHKSDVRKAKELMLSAGYEWQGRLTTAQEAAYLETQCEYHFARDGGRIQVELQWGFVPWYYSLPWDVERLWGRLVRVSLGEATVSTFAPDDLLPILCVHAAKHCWERLEWVSDVAELLRACPNLDWDRVFEEAKASGSLRMILLGLELASDLLGTAIPEKAAEAIGKDGAVKQLAAWVVARLFREVSGEAALQRAFDDFRFRLRSRERLGDRLCYCLRRTLATTPDDWAVLPLPKSLFPLYGFLRPFRLAGRYARLLLTGRR